MDDLLRIAALWGLIGIAIVLLLAGGWTALVLAVAVPLSVAAATVAVLTRPSRPRARWCAWLFGHHVKRSRIE